MRIIAELLYPLLVSIFAMFMLYDIDAHAMQGAASIGSIATNPAANAVLAPAVTLSGGLTNGSSWTFNVLVSATVQSTVILQILNTSSAVVNSVYFLVPANTSFTWTSSPISFRLPNGYSARIINSAAITGSVQASLFYASDGDY